MSRRESTASWLLVGCMVLLGGPVMGQAEFRRGDANGDGGVDVSDAAYTLNYSFKGGSTPSCADAADANDSGDIDLSDAVFTWFFLYGENVLGLPDSETPGPDPTDGDGLTCAAYSPATSPRLADFALDFECQDQVFGRGAKTFEVFATLTTSGNNEAFGAEGWSVSLGIKGGRITGIEVAGVRVAGVEAGVPFDMDLGEADFNITKTSPHEDDPGRGGAVMAVLLRTTKKRTLRPSSTERIARITVEVDIPATGDPSPVTLAYEDGFLASVRPVKNVVSMAGTSQTPTLGRCTIPLRRGDDCDNNGIDDAQDIAADLSLDCTGNGVLDACELVDCNKNSIHDCRDLALETSKDCDADLVPDECQLECNGNGVPDACDVASGTSRDCNANGTPDECEPDCNGNGIPDTCDVAAGTSMDCDFNGIPDECDLDCQPNGIPDACEIAAGKVADTNGDGIPDQCEGSETKYELGFDCPAVVVGEPGEVKTFEIYPTLTTTNAAAANCVQGGIFGLTIQGASVLSFDVNGVTVRTILDGTKLSIADLGTIPAPGGFTVSRCNLGEDPSKELLASCGYLSATRLMVFAPGTQRIARIVIEATVPEGEAGNEVSVKFEEVVCNQLPGEPRGCFFFKLNSLIVQGNNVSPSSLGECKFLVREGVAGRQLPSDGNQDGDLDISDGIHLLSFLFLGTVTSLPCGDGTSGDPANLALLDSNGDGTIDLADAIRVFGFLFQGAAPPVLGTECVPIAECPESAEGCGV